ncbi:Single-stranded DNA binding protein [Halapricum hydrolyticum]|uniref:Single-stranded DNA binding protein n=1 Tax=Halapricum hydrolyticum TaxID=2979991 RepID=A0AAE3ICN3_9EURY|nr:Single-stranded DNA binding protein [Halapricum hydrolyticum]MCU4718637.1 Single-stranded DNA binding protein [Halapricum hydrolyticum]MCU4727677.1 Single-stranded DNA binding protein [Halapricum hydrolyticum]
MNLDNEAEELASTLGVDKTEVKRDLENLVSYSVPLEEAKQSLRRKYGDGDDGSSSEPESKDLAEVSPEDSNVTVTGRILTVGKRSIRYQGADHTIYEGEIADETGTLSYTAWEDFDLEPGDTIRAGNAGVREWEGQPELNLGESTSVEKREETLTVPYEIGGDAELIALEPGDRGINAEVTVLECERKVIDGRDGETEILSGVLADETARLPFTDWDPHPEIEEGASIRIENTYVREFRGAPSINVSEFSTVETLDRTVEATETAPRLSIRDALGSGGMFDVEVLGDVIAVRDGSGLIERCPECGRIVQNGQCRTHGQVEAVEDLRTKAILDDGTGTVTAILDDELTAEVYGGDVEDAREHARDAMDKEVVADAIRETIVGRTFQVRGTLSIDEYGANLNATDFAEVADDPADRAAALLAEVNA